MGREQDGERVGLKCSMPSLETAVSIPWNLIARPSKAFLASEIMERFAECKNVDENIITFKNTLLEQNGLSASIVDDEYMVSVKSNWDAYLGPCGAVLGGLVAQELLKVIRRDGQPTDNFLLFDGLETFAAIVEHLHEK